MMRLNRILLVLVSVLVVVLLLTGCVTITGEETATETTTTSTSETASTTVAVAPRVDRMAPGFELDNLDGQSVSLESLRGRYVMLNFWATWCGPCRNEMPFMQEIYENPDWSARDMVMVAVNVGESVSQAKAFMDEFGFEFQILLDSDTRIAAAYNIRGIPTTFFIDQDGIIRDIRVGTFRNKAEIEEMLTDLING